MEGRTEDMDLGKEQDERCGRQVAEKLIFMMSEETAA
jgi:hypothetical protein